MIASNTVSTFQLISDNLDKLTYTGIGTKYHCPVCNGNDFSVDQDKEKYKCFNKGCASGDIREAILILSGGVVSNIGSRYQRGSHKKVDKNKIPASKVYLPYIPEQIDTDAFLRLSTPVPYEPEYTPGIEKEYVKNKKKYHNVPTRSLTYWYSDTQGVERKEYHFGMDTDGNNITDKTFTQFYIDENGQKKYGKGSDPWPLYRINEVLDLLTDIDHVSVTVPLLLSLEGEKNVEIARNESLAAICIKASNYGSNNIPSEELIRGIEELKEKNSKQILVHLCDNDDRGRDKGNTLLQACKQVGLGCIVVDLRKIIPTIREKGDIEQLLEAMDNSKELIDKLIRYIYDEIAEVRDRHIDNTVDNTLNDSDFDTIDIEPSKKNKLPKPREVADEIAQNHDDWWYHSEQVTWRVWNGKYWESVTDFKFTQLVSREVRELNIDYPKQTYITDVVAVLKDILGVPHKPCDTKQYINFNNGVLDSSTGRLLNHDSNRQFISALPFNYIDEMDGNDPIELLKKYCPNTWKYFDYAMESDHKRILKLLAITNGVIKYRFHDLQMFVHLIGKPGSGKGVFVRMLQKCVGKENYKGASLSTIDQNTELASIIDKQLVLLPDERKQVGVETILKLTGGDEISYRQIYKESASAPFLGSLVVVSNDPIFTGNTKGLDRRLSLTVFNRSVAAKDRNPQLEVLIESELCRLIPIALRMSDSDVTALIKGEGDYGTEGYAIELWNQKIITNSVAAFMDECVVLKSHDIVGAQNLFDAYIEYCDSAGVKNRFNKNNFSGQVEELIDFLGWDAQFRRNNAHKFWSGIVLREQLSLKDEADSKLPQPTISQWLEGVETPSTEIKIVLTERSTRSTQPLPSEDSRSTLGSTLGLHQVYTTPNVADDAITDDSAQHEPSDSEVYTPCRPSVDPGVDLKPLPSKESVDRVDLNGKTSDQTNFQLPDDSQSDENKPSESGLPKFTKGDKVRLKHGVGIFYKGWEGIICDREICCPDGCETVDMSVKGHKIPIQYIDINDLELVS